MLETNNIVSLNISTNIWFNDIKDIKINFEQYDKIANDLITECNNHHDYNNAYQYDKHVNAVISKINYDDFNFEIDSMNNNKKFFVLKILEKVLSAKNHNINDWHDGINSAYRTLRCFNAYLTPGFIEAKNNSLLSNN